MKQRAERHFKWFELLRWVIILQQLPLSVWWMWPIFNIETYRIHTLAADWLLPLIYGRLLNTVDECCSTEIKELHYVFNLCFVATKRYPPSAHHVLCPLCYRKGDSISQSPKSTLKVSVITSVIIWTHFPIIVGNFFYIPNVEGPSVCVLPPSLSLPVLLTVLCLARPSFSSSRPL